ncbi:cytochrome P450 [Xylariomycetidae sp. FL0641]|nr:cytochrome P450 [Xylariomycetidae sp. FL0641]
MFDDALSRPAVLAPALLLAGYVLYQLLRPSKLPPGLPILGAKPGEWFPLWRARWRNFKGFKTATQVAYQQHRSGACILPVAGCNDIVLLPASELQWLVDQPDSSIAIQEQINDSLQLDYTVMDPKLSQHPTHVSLISAQLTRETGNLVPDLLDEIAHAVDEFWGASPEWRPICVYDAMRHIIGRATNRVFVGLPLCRDPALLDMGMAFAQDVPLASTVLRFVWRPLRPLVAPLVTLPNRLHTRKFFGIVRPEIERRLRAAEDPEKKGLDKEPNDFLQWALNQAKASGDPYMYHPDTLAGRVLLLNFASIHTSSFAITHALLDLAGSASAADLEALRAEITGALAAQPGGMWNKRALAAMPKLDSVFRESQRLNSFVTVATMRMVSAPDGVTTPSGVKLPRGASVGAQSYPVFHDGDLYPDPETFRPFRFAERREQLGADGEKSSYVQSARQAFATTSPDYAAFGHGRHACPGRFFAAAELKLMLAYLVLHYDIDVRPGTRPRNTWFGINRVPPMTAEIRVRRRSPAAAGTS